MSTLPAAGHISVVADQASAKSDFEALRNVVSELPGGEASTTLTIAGGVVTPTRGIHDIDTEAAAATDDLDTIGQANHPDGRLLLIRPVNAGHKVVVRHNIGGAGKVLLTDSVNFSMSSTKTWLLLKRVGTTWEEVLRFYGDKLEDMRAWLQVEPDTVSTALDRNVTAADRGKVITLTGAAARTFTFTATPAALGDGWSCYVRNASTADLTIVPASGLVDGKATFVLKSGELIELQSDATGMSIIGGRLLWRERLNANRTYYVRTDGNDANTGLVNTAGGAFATIQKAWDTIRDTLDLAGFIATVQVADGTYTAGTVLRGPCVGQQDENKVVIQGNAATPANVLINCTSIACFQADGAWVTLKDMELRTTTSGDGILARDNSQVAISGLRFGACANNHMSLEDWSQIQINGNYSITGGAQRHIYIFRSSGVNVNASTTITLTGTPAFSSFFISVNSSGNYDGPLATFSGAATGQRYIADMNGTIWTNGGGASFFPGNVAGSVTRGGQYA